MPPFSLKSFLGGAALAALLSAAPALAQPPQAADHLAPDGGWTAPHAQDHPLVGRIWDRAAQDFTTPEAAFDRAAGARFVLLGEKHDNADHHRLQARFLAEMVERGRRPAVAWEMFHLDQAPALEAYIQAHPGVSAGLGAAVGWADTGWPDWEIYDPIAAVAMQAGLPMAAANLPGPQVRALSRQGPDALPADLRAALDLPEPLAEGLPAPVADVLRTAVIEGHCGMMPEAMTEPMMRVQAARDALMAHTLLDGAALASGDGGVLIAGNGHIRSDAGVPWHLGRLGKGDTDRDVLTVAMVEVSPDTQDPAAFAARYWAEGQPPFDLMVFTPLTDLGDPCEAMRAQMNRAARHHAEPPVKTSE